MSDKAHPAPTAPLEATGALKVGLLRPGTEVLQGRFKVLELLGRGGMGDVYLAEQISLGRKVALKTLREDMSLQPGMTERFKREARLLSTVDHPSIVRVIDFGEAEGAYVLVMEFVEGENLAAEVRRGPLEVSRALAVMKDIADGLAAIHAQGIIHRDLKPDNVLLTVGPEGEHARLLDFGIARLAEEQGVAAMTQAGLVLGTPEYLAPEQATGGLVDARSDVYAFGVLAYRMLAGRHPFPGPSARDFLLQHITQQPPELVSVAPQLAAQGPLLALVMSCLSKEPSQRPDGGKGLVAALGKLEARPLATATQLTPAPVASTPPAPPFSPTVPSRQVTGASASLTRARNLAVVHVDLKGFQALSAKLSGEESAQLLADFQRLVSAPLKRLGGQLVHRWQDRAFATFESPTGAVEFGRAVQDGLWRANAALPAERQLGVGIAVHQGEVIVSGDSIVGEPAQLVAEAGKLAGAGEVVFTQTIWLSMNRAAVASEPRGALSVPGNPDLPLYRCAWSAEGAPFGGADLKAGERPYAGLLVKRALALMGRLSQVDRRLRLAAVAALAGVVLVGWLVGARDSTLAQAGKHLDDGQPAAALELLEGSKRRSEPAYRLLKAEALHQTKRHRDEWELVKGVPSDALEDLRHAALVGLLEDYVKSDHEEVLRAALSKLPRGQLAEVEDLATGPASTVQWGAVHYLDQARVPGVDLVSAFVISLESPDCSACAEAARRLGELGDTRAIEPLERLKRSSRKGKVLFFSTNCGQDEAEAALANLNAPAE